MIFKGFQPNEIVFFLSEREKKSIFRNITKEELKELGVDPGENINLERFTNDFETIINELFNTLNIETSEIYSVMKLSSEERKELMNLIDCSMPNGHNQKDIAYRIDFLITKANDEMEDFIGELELPKNRIPLIPDKIYIVFDKISDLTNYVQNKDIKNDNPILKVKKKYFLEINDIYFANLEFHKEAEEYNGHITYFLPEDAKEFSKAASAKHIKIV